MARDPVRAAARERLSRTSSVQKAPERPSRMRIWLKRRRTLLRPALYGAAGLGVLAVAVLAVRAVDPAGRVRSLAESTTDKLADLINEHAEAVVSSALDDTMPHASADASYRAGFADGLGHAITTLRGK